MCMSILLDVVWRSLPHANKVCGKVKPHLSFCPPGGGGRATTCPSATHTLLATHTHSAMHYPLPCMPPAMHTPCHACPLPHMLPCRACPPAMHTPLPHMAPLCHAHPPAMHALLPCMPPAATHASPTIWSMSGRYASYWNASLLVMWTSHK